MKDDGAATPRKDPLGGELDRSCDELVPRRLDLRKDSVLTASGQLKPGVSVRFRVLGECRPGIKPAARLEIIRSGGEAEVPTGENSLATRLESRPS